MKAVQSCEFWQANIAPLHAPLIAQLLHVPQSPLLSQPPEPLELEAGPGPVVTPTLACELDATTLVLLVTTAEPLDPKPPVDELPSSEPPSPPAPDSSVIPFAHAAADNNVASSKARAKPSKSVVDMCGHSSPSRATKAGSRPVRGSRFQIPGAAFGRGFGPGRCMSRV